jgi:hypothetical protein
MTQQPFNASEMAQLHDMPSLKHNPRSIMVKPRLLDLLNKHHICTVHLARAAHLQVNTVRAIALQGKAVQPVVAMQVLHGLWELTGRQYVLTDVDIAVLPYN